MAKINMEYIAQQMKEHIETELGLYVEVVHNGRGYSFFPMTTTGQIIGETRLVMAHTQTPIMFVTNRGYFTCLEGMALASRFQSRIEREMQAQNTLILTPEMQIDGDSSDSVMQFSAAQKMAESLK